MDDPVAEPLPGLLAGGIDGVLAVHDTIAADLHGYAWFLLDPRRHAGEGDPAAAVLDALLVAGETAAELVDPALSRAWLYALTRNECLRRRPPDWPAVDAEAGELGRHRLSVAEVAAVLGQAVPVPVEAPPPAPVEAAPAVPAEAAPAVPAEPPGWLRDELVAALGVDGAGRRAELARRAHPYDPEGFPVPVDSRRLSGRTLAWSAAAAVLIALALLVSLPAGGATRALPGPAVAAAVPVQGAGVTAGGPLPTLPATAFGLPGTSASRPRPAPDRGAERRPASAVLPGAQGPQQSTGDERLMRTALALTWHASPNCGEVWTADLRVRPYGADQAAIAAATASVTAGAPARTVALIPAGGTWRGALTGLPADQQVTVTVRAAARDGETLGSVTGQLIQTC